MPHAEVHRDEFTISTDPKRLDVEGTCAFLEQTYWGKARTRPVMRKAFRNSLCFGVYCGQEQIGFARAVTDFATFAYLADVFIIEAFRKRGLGRWLIETVLNHPELKGLRRWALITQDAHGLYRTVGFRELENPEQYMELKNPWKPDAQAKARIAESNA